MPIRKIPYTPILGWSASRYRIFQECQREYYYEYYGKYHPHFSRIGVLKKLTSIPLEAGNIVHDLNKQILQRLTKTTEPLNLEKLYQVARQTTLSYCGAKQFQEVHYQGLTAIDAEQVYEKVRHSLDNILTSDRFKWITEKAIVNRDQWVIEPPGYGEARIDGLKVYCKVDFLFPLHQEMYIVDWKTGRHEEEKHHTQLKGYTVWASYHFNTPPEQIIPIIAYLNPTYEEAQVSFGAEDIKHFSEQIRKETQEMYLKCADVDNNVPVEKVQFCKTTDEGSCSRCKYQEVCEKDFDF